jgi:hypothetical protein
MGYDPGAAKSSRFAQCAGPRKQLEFYSASLQRSLSHHQRLTTHTSHRHALAREARRFRRLESWKGVTHIRRGQKSLVSFQDS